MASNRTPHGNVYGNILQASQGPAGLGGPASELPAAAQAPPVGKWDKGWSGGDWRCGRVPRWGADRWAIRSAGNTAVAPTMAVGWLPKSLGLSAICWTEARELGRRNHVGRQLPQ